MLKQEFIKIGLKCENSNEVLKNLATLLLENGVVKESFINAVIDRENVYPTGLPTMAFNIAIPHTISSHVVEPAMSVAILENPIEFKQMGSPEISLNVELVIMLAIKDAKQQISLLKKIMSLLQDVNKLNALKLSKNPEQVLNLLSDLNK